MPKINLDFPLRDLRNQIALRDGKEVSMREQIAEALSVQGGNMEVGKKLRIGALAYKLIGSSGEIDTTADEVVDMKEAVGNACSPIVALQIMDVLNKY